MSFHANRVLITEDHDIFRRLLQSYLASWEFEVTTASDGEEALRIITSHDPPAIAILDWMMPKLDGLEVCTRVRAAENRPYVYLVMLTAKGQSGEIAAGLEAGADDYIVKPFDPDELRARLKVGQRVVSLERALAARVAELQEAIDDVKALKTLIPICMYCKSVRDDRDYWHQIEEYIHKETGSDFSHGICPACMTRLAAGGGVIR
jgi:DNA-binding response OmpR family regulator